MLQLTPPECRILGTLVEKAQTTPAQYPMTLNALTTGCNQKNNRDPITNYSEDDVLDALEALRRKGLVRDVMLAGSRVTKYRHLAREVLGIDTTQLVLLTELLLRGPQTSGELRSRASRMFALESLEVVEAVLDGMTQEAAAGDAPPAPPASPTPAPGQSALAAPPRPLVRKLAPAPGTRAPRYAQLLCPTLHPLDSSSTAAAAEPMVLPLTAPDAELTERIERLETEVNTLRGQLERLAAALGHPLS